MEFIVYVSFGFLLIGCIKLAFWLMKKDDEIVEESWDDKYGNRYISIVNSDGDVEYIECKELNGNAH